MILPKHIYLVCTISEGAEFPIMNGDLNGICPGGPMIFTHYDMHARDILSKEFSKVPNTMLNGCTYCDYEPDLSVHRSTIVVYTYDEEFSAYMPTSRSMTTEFEGGWNCRTGTTGVYSHAVTEPKDAFDEEKFPLPRQEILHFCKGDLFQRSLTGRPIRIPELYFYGEIGDSHLGRIDTSIIDFKPMDSPDDDSPCFFIERREYKAEKEIVWGHNMNVCNEMWKKLYDGEHVRRGMIIRIPIEALQMAMEAESNPLMQLAVMFGLVQNDSENEENDDE